MSRWSSTSRRTEPRLGHRLPNASANDVTLGPDGHTVVAGTHGRGIWTLSLDD